MVSQTVIVMVVSPLLHIIENGGVPPVIEANNVAQSGGVIVVSFPAFTTGESNTVTFIVSLATQLESVTCTQYVPVVVTNSVCAVELSDHRYVSNPGPASSNKPPRLEQKEVSFPKFTSHWGGGSFEIRTFTVSVDIHPFASVTVSIYVVAVVSQTTID